MRKHPIAILTLTVIAIMAFAATRSFMILQSVPYEEFRVELGRSAQDDEIKILSTNGSGRTEPLPLLHRMKFPGTPLMPMTRFRDGTTVNVFQDEGGLFQLTAQSRRDQVCYVVLKNDSAHDETLEAAKRRLRASFSGLTVIIAD